MVINVNYVKKVMLYLLEKYVHLELLQIVKVILVVMKNQKCNVYNVMMDFIYKLVIKYVVKVKLIIVEYIQIINNIHVQYVWMDTI